MAPTRLTHVAEHLFGRESELSALDAAWADPDTHVVTFVGWGGVGKTSLVAKWAAGKDLGGADYFDWSFYSQGTREEGSASGEPFIAAALRFFGEADGEGEKIASTTMSGWDKGAKLAGSVAKRKALLILDGLEPLQYPPSSPLAGQLKDPGVTALLKGLAAQNPGLCVVTTREGVKDLAAFHGGTAPEWSLERLGKDAGVALLEELQVKGSKAELEKLVEGVDGHALTISILGSYLRGLFDRPADQACLAALRKEPAIPGPTEPLVGLTVAQWNLAVSRLTARGLASSEGSALDAHPLIREYFARQLRKTNLQAWRAAHGRLFEHLRDTTPHQPDTLEGLQPLYQAVAHGCHAGRQQETCEEIYRDRIQRGQKAFSTKKLGAFCADLGAVACFFDPPWRRVSPALTEAAQAWLLNEAAYCLRALGRLAEALEPMRVSMEIDIAVGEWKGAAISASNLSELELTLGFIPAAVRDAEHSVTVADRSGDSYQRMVNRATNADTEHQAGRRAKALALFRAAEELQAEWQPTYSRLYSLRGFQYCDLLLAEVERAGGSAGRGGSGRGGYFFGVTGGAP